MAAFIICVPYLRKFTIVLLSSPSRREDDMEAVKLLKRKLSLAVSEEDYGTAAKIRDHPYMKLYKELHSNRSVCYSSRHASRCIAIFLRLDHI